MASNLSVETAAEFLVSSTHNNEAFSINKFIPIFPIENPNGDIFNHLDFLDHKLTTLLNNITAWTPYTYDGIEKISAIAYKFYNTTTLWWVIMMYNGYIHPLEITPGVVIKIPDINTVNDYLREVKKQTGKIITI